MTIRSASPPPDYPALLERAQRLFGLNRATRVEGADVGRP